VYQKSYSDGTPTAKYGFDGVAGIANCPPAIAVTNPTGRRTAMCDGSGKNSWSYDSMGRELTEQKTIGSVTETVSHIYNLDGSIATETYPSGRVITYTPGGAGRDLSAIDTANSISYATGATYAPQGILAGYSSATSGSTVSGAITYNSRLQPLQLYYTTGTISSSTLSQMQGNACPTTTASIMSRSYNFGLGTNDNGNIYSVANCRDGNRTQNFLYDSLNRIQQAYTNGSNWGETFGPAATNPGVPPSTSGIDAWGNLTNRSPVNGKTNYENLSVGATIQNQLTGFGYDANGNMTQNGNAQYSYDAENRLIAAGGMSYIYDGDGERVKKCTEGATAGTCATNPTGTLYWGSGPLTETDLSGNLAGEYVFFNGRRIARREASGTVFYYFNDHLGSASVITYATGSVKEESDFYPYGGEIPISGSDTNHYKFTGKERDSESGLDNFGARYDSSSLGRFMTPDWSEKPTSVPYAVFGDPQTLNLYAYVENAPINKADADGHIAGVDDAAEALTVGALIFGTAATIYVSQPENQRSFSRALSQGTDTVVSKLKGLFSHSTTVPKNPARPGTLGKPDHQQTVKEEAARIGGKTEVPISTPGGFKDSRRGDAVKKDANGKVTEVVQVYRPTPAGNIPKREKEAAQDIQNATGVTPTMVPVRPQTQPGNAPANEIEGSSGSGAGSENNAMKQPQASVSRE